MVLKPGPQDGGFWVELYARALKSDSQGMLSFGKNDPGSLRSGTRQ